MESHRLAEFSGAARSQLAALRRAWREVPPDEAGDGAHELWRGWPEAPGASSLVHRAVLAASAHNSQPWRFRQSGDSIAISADLDRHLGSFDPFRREMHLSLGCALENLILAARAEGLDAGVETPPGTLPPPASGQEAASGQGGASGHEAAPGQGPAAGQETASGQGGAPGHEAAPGQGPAAGHWGAPGHEAAIVTLTPAERAVTDLFLAIPQRHTHRGAYRPDRAIPVAVLDEMAAMASSSGELRLFLFQGREMAPLGRLIVSTTEAIVADRQMAADNAKWFRFHESEVQERRDGLTLDASVVPPLRNVAAKIFPPSGGRANRRWLRDTARIHVATAPLLGMIAVRDLYDRPTALSAGRLWQRLHLLLTARGLAAHPLNQPAERIDRERELGQPATAAAALSAITGEPSWLPTFIFRAGHADRPARPSPRRRVEEVMF
jgi:hypothetical protein